MIYLNRTQIRLVSKSGLALREVVKYEIKKSNANNIAVIGSFDNWFC